MSPHKELPKVLVVDDEPLMGATLAVTLGDEYRVKVVASVDAAEATLLDDRGYAVILCDLQMPGRTGMDLYRSLREHDPDLAARMVFMSGGAYTPEAHDFIEKSGRTTIDKPFDVDDLLDVMRRTRSEGP